MGRKTRPKSHVQQVIDATEQRLQRAIDESGSSGDAWDYIDPSRIDSHNAIGLVRRFKASHLDRLYRKDRPETSALTFRQHYAGDWYRNVHARAGYSMTVIASYGERVSGVEPAYGLPRTMRQADARKMWREARTAFPSHMADLMDRFLLHDFIPGFAGTRASQRGRTAFIREISYSLDCLADYLKLAREPRAA